MNQMNIWDQVVDFVTRLLRGRVDGAGITAKSHLKNLEVQAKTAASKRFNNVVDGTMNKAKDKARARAEAPKKPAAPE
ncbi:MAG: hypothetical protein ACI9WU_000133 [Myxococcota bacterium]|jgi:hypothetical protein